MFFIQFPHFLQRLGEWNHCLAFLIDKADLATLGNTSCTIREAIQHFIIDSRDSHMSLFIKKPPFPIARLDGSETRYHGFLLEINLSREPVRFFESFGNHPFPEFVIAIAFIISYDDNIFCRASPMGDFLIFRRNNQFSFTVCISPFPFDLYDHFVFIIGAIEVIGRRQVDLPFGIHIAEFVVFIEELTGADGREVHAIGAHHLHDTQERTPSEPALLFFKQC